MFDAVADGRIKALWIMCTNPAVSMPDADRVARAIAGCDFTVVSDIMARTDTTRLADVLLVEAGYHAARSGDMSRTDFMNNLAKIWAGLPNSSGRSHYHGYAGNRASMTWARFDAEMARIFPG